MMTKCGGGKMLPANTLSHIYNPLNQTEEEALKNFVVRQKEFQCIHLLLAIFEGLSHGRRNGLDNPEYTFCIGAVELLHSSCRLQ